MTGSLEMKITISECVTPALFQAMTAVSNPRQRAALIKRLAEVALRGNVIAPNPQLAASASASAMNNPGSNSDRVASAPKAADPVRMIEGPRGEARIPDREPVASNEEGQFDYAFLADKLGDF